MAPVFKNIMGGFLTKALFYEMTLSDKSSVVYTLKDKDHQGYPSLYRLYMETNDPTEYKFAVAYLGGWDHWEQLCECSWFKPHVTSWRKELEIRMRSNALARIMSEAKTTSREAFAANRYILEKGWEPKDGQTKRGRPTKDDIKAAANEIASTNSRLQEDFERITLKAVN